MVGRWDGVRGTHRRDLFPDRNRVLKNVPEKAGILIPASGSFGWLRAGAPTYKLANELASYTDVEAVAIARWRGVAAEQSNSRRSVERI